MVSSVDATRSLHGTLVQCVQPLPASVILSNAEVQKKRLVVLTTEWLPWLQDTKVIRSLFWYWRLIA